MEKEKLRAGRMQRKVRAAGQKEMSGSIDTVQAYKKRWKTRWQENFLRGKGVSGEVAKLKGNEANE